MANKKSIDSKLIAKSQTHETKYVSSVWHSLDGKHLPMSVLKDVVKRVGKSRRKVYAVLTYLGYVYKPKKKK